MVDPSSYEEGKEGGPRKLARRRDAGYEPEVFKYAAHFEAGAQNHAPGD